MDRVDWRRAGRLAAMTWLVSQLLLTFMFMVAFEHLIAAYGTLGLFLSASLSALPISIGLGALVGVFSALLSARDR